MLKTLNKGLSKIKAMKKEAKHRPGKESDQLDRQTKVARTAYFLAEKRGFGPGEELHDWVVAENMVDAGRAH